MLQRLVVTGILVICGLIGMSQPAHAATPSQLINITPSSSSVKIDPGASLKGSVSVINEGTADFKVDLSSAPYRVEGLNYTPKFTLLAGATDASKWVSFDTSISQILPAQKLLPVDYTITVPAGTAAGGYYAVIFAQTSTIDSAAGVVPHHRVGDIIYITVNGPVRSIGTAEATSVPTIISTVPVTLGVIVGNTGGLHFMTKVDISVKNLFGKTAFSYTAKRYILPQTKRDINTAWSPQTPLGVYRIERSAMLPSGTQQLASQWVLVVKEWVVVVAFGVIAAIGIGLAMNLTRIRRKSS